MVHSCRVYTYCCWRYTTDTVVQIRRIEKKNLTLSGTANSGLYGWHFVIRNKFDKKRKKDRKFYIITLVGVRMYYRFSMLNNNSVRSNLCAHGLVCNTDVPKSTNIEQILYTTVNPWNQTTEPSLPINHYSSIAISPTNKTVTLDLARTDSLKEKIDPSKPTPRYNWFRPCEYYVAERERERCNATRALLTQFDIPATGHF